MAKITPAVLAVMGMILGVVGVGAGAGEMDAATGLRSADVLVRRAGAKSPAVVVAKTSSPDIVLNVRALLTRRAPKDPIKLAVHFDGAKGPLTPYSKPRPPAIDFVKTFESITFELTTPNGLKYSLRAAVTDNRAQWKKQVNDLARNATWFVDLTAGGFQTSSGIAGNWQVKDRPDLTQPGEYRLALAGRLVTADKKAAEFKCTAPATRVVAGYKTAAELDKLGMQAIGRHLPAFKPAKSGGTESGYAPGLIYEDAEGNRVIHRNGVIGQQRWGYDLARVVISPHGAARSVAHRSVSTCVAAGTPIDTPRGAVRIELLREGEQVWAYDMKARRRVAATIRTIRRTVATHTLRIGKSLRITPNHPVCTPAGLLLAGQLKRTDRLFVRRGRWIAMPTPRLDERLVTVFDLTVDSPHTYFAGGVLVHNKDRAWTPWLDNPWHFYWPPKPHKFTIAFKAPPGAEARPGPDPKDVAEAIERLGHNNWQVREAATEKLKKMGKAAHPMLRQVRKQKGLDPEVAQRIDVILKPPPAAPAKSATDPATGITVSVEPDGSIAARKGGKMVWKLKMAGNVTAVTIVNERVLASPNNAQIDLKTGMVLSVGGGMER